MSLQERNNVHCYGDGSHTMMLVHGYGCDQTMWRFLYPSFAERYQVILLDLVGGGGSDRSAYDRDKYGSLHGYADDMLEIIDEFATGPVIFVGHSVSAMIGMLATIKAPDRFLAQVMVGPSPSFINDDDYVGGYNPEDIAGLLKMMDDNYLEWTKVMAPTIMGAPAQPALAKELLVRFQANDREIARHFARVTFTADHRADVEKSTVPALILQCSDDLIAPREVGEYLHKHLANSVLKVITNVGHCPHMSAPSASSDVITHYLDRLLGDSYPRDTAEHNGAD
jgi:sigma-B regulation protein RsbQ